MNIKALAANVDERILDKLLGLKIEEPHHNPNKDAELDSTLGKASWSNGGHYSSGYNDLIRAVEVFESLYFPGERKVIDIGCGYGRLGHIIAANNYFSRLNYLGVEINPQRVDMANTAKKKNPLGLNYDKVTFQVGDVSNELPDGHVYYMYDPVNKDTLKKILNDIASKDNKYVYYKYGRSETESIILRHTGFTRITQELYITKK